MSKDPHFPKPSGIRDIGEVKIVSRKAYEAEHPAPETPSKQTHQATRPSGVFVPSHMLSPGATVEEAATVARGLGVTTHAPAAHHAPSASSSPKAIGPQELDHEYDGIKEYDNPTPGWWYLVWAGSAVFSVIYVVVYHSSLVPTLHERHAAIEARALDVRFAELRKLPEGEDKLLRIMAEPNWLGQGESIFISACSLCHGQQAEGLVGPNLTDEFFKNATTLSGLYDVVLHGTANGAMPPKGGAPLKNEEIALVSAYVASLRGTNLPGPRGPEGVEIPPFPEPLDEIPADAAGG